MVSSLNDIENVEQAKIRFLTEAECKRLINAARPDFRELLKAALFTGARCSELTQLEVSSVTSMPPTFILNNPKMIKADISHCHPRD